VDHDDKEHAALKAFNELWKSKFAEDSLLVFSTGRSHHLYEELRVRDLLPSVPGSAGCTPCEDVVTDRASQTAFSILADLSLLNVRPSSRFAPCDAVTTSAIDRHRPLTNMPRVKL